MTQPEGGNKMLVPLSATNRKELLNQITHTTQPGDILLFYHRTSWRSRTIKVVTKCRKPHLAVYAGKEQIIGMLKGKVRRHRIGRFLKPEYDLQIVRGNASILKAIKAYINRRESKRDLMIILVMLMWNRIFGGDIRNILPYKMAGVTCSGIVSSAIHNAYMLKSRHLPLMDTPKDAELLIGKLGLRTLLEFELIGT